MNRTALCAVGTDEAGSLPMLLQEEDALPGGEAGWRLVAQTDDHDDAQAVMELLYRKCFSEPPDLA